LVGIPLVPLIADCADDTEDAAAMTIIPMGSGNVGPLIGALIATAAALFVLCQRLPAPYGWYARKAAIAVYGVTLAGVLIYIGLWLLRVEF
jgi:hypothetical protein